MFNLLWQNASAIPQLSNRFPPDLVCASPITAGYQIQGEFDAVTHPSERCNHFTFFPQHDATRCSECLQV